MRRPLPLGRGGRSQCTLCLRCLGVALVRCFESPFSTVAVKELRWSAQNGPRVSAPSPGNQHATALKAGLLEPTLPAPVWVLPCVPAGLPDPWVES